MKKTFRLTSEKIATARLVEAIKHEIRKYLKRERAKKLPENHNYWEFDCRIGETQESAEVIAVADIFDFINHAEQSQMPVFYLEIFARPAYKELLKKPTEKMKRNTSRHPSSEEDSWDDEESDSHFDD